MGVVMIKINKFRAAAAFAAVIAATSFATSTSANPLNLFSVPLSRAEPAPATAMAYAAPSPRLDATVTDDGTQLAARFKRQIVDYRGSEAPGTIIIDTPNTYLYLVVGNGKAYRYGIGVGREGFTWSGTQHITKKAEWPDWTPPEEMIQRQPYLPRFMAGGPGNPLGARAMYLGGTIYRIHGTNAPSTIGGRVSSGCIRMTNEDVADLYSRVNVGTKVVVMPMTARSASSAMASAPVR
jgi:lipoprotein-anchoring transpeptidase ErfK/SrfK